MRSENSAHASGADAGDADPAVAVGQRRDRHLEEQRARGVTRATTAEHALQVEVELVADLGQQDAEGGAVELVDGVEPEQDDAAGAPARRR